MATKKTRSAGSRLDAVDGRLDAVEGRLGAVEGRLGAVDGRLGAVEGRLGAVEGRLDSMVETMKAGFETLSRKITEDVGGLRADLRHLAEEFNGYTRREATIYEMKMCRLFEEGLGQRRFVKAPFTKVFSSRSKQAAEFDGLYLVDFVPPKNAAPRSNAATQSQFTDRVSIAVKDRANADKALQIAMEKETRRRAIEEGGTGTRENGMNGGTGTATDTGIATLTLKSNSMAPYPNSRKPRIVMIEAKHDVDKAKVDFKLEQMAALVRDVDARRPGTRRRNTASSRGPGAGSQGQGDAAFQWFQEHLEPGGANLVVLFAADNWTAALEEYVQTLTNGVELDEKEYDELSTRVLGSHDAELLRALKDAKNQVVSGTGEGPEARARAKLLDLGDAASIRAFDATRFGGTFKTLVQRVQNYVRLPRTMGWGMWYNRVGAIRPDGTTTAIF